MGINLIRSNKGRVPWEDHPKYLFSNSMMAAWILWCRMCTCWSATASFKSVISSKRDCLSRLANTNFLDTVGITRTFGELGDGGDPGSSHGAKSRANTGSLLMGPGCWPGATQVPPHSPASCGQGSATWVSHVCKRRDKSYDGGMLSGRTPQHTTLHGPASLHLGSHAWTLVLQSHPTWSSLSCSSVVNPVVNDTKPDIISSLQFSKISTIEKKQRFTIQVLDKVLTWIINSNLTLKLWDQLLHVLWLISYIVQMFQAKERGE